MEVESEQKVNKEVFVPIVYGNISFWLGKKADTQASHKWICYVRGLNNEDLSYFIHKVVFTLHPSFTDNVREVYNYPFEIQEVGWGEFEIQIKIYFKEEYHKPLEVFHLLKLHPSQVNAQQSTRKPIVSEFYDEIVFLNCSKSFGQLITQPPPLPPQHHPPLPLDDDNYQLNYHQFHTTFDFHSNYHQIIDATEFLDNEILNLQNKILALKDDIDKHYQTQILHHKKINNNQSQGVVYSQDKINKV